MEIVVESNTPYVTREWFSDKAIVLFTVKKDDKSSIDIFADWIIETVKNWKSEKPLLIGYDLSAVRILTPSGIRRAMDVYDAVPTEGIIGRTAIIYGHSTISSFLVSFSERAMKIQNQQMARQFFKNRERAIDWMKYELNVINEPLLHPTK